MTPPVPSQPVHLVWLGSCTLGLAGRTLATDVVTNLFGHLFVGYLPKGRVAAIVAWATPRHGYFAVNLLFALGAGGFAVRRFCHRLLV